MLDKLSGWKTYLTALGGVCFAIYLATTGDYNGAVETLLAAIGAASLRHGITTEALKDTQWTTTGSRQEH